MDKGLQEIGVGGKKMKENLETTNYLSAGSGEQPRLRPLSEIAFRRKTQKIGVAGATLSWISESKKDLDHPNSVRPTIEIGWRYLRRGTKAKKTELEEPGTQLKIPVGKDRVKKSPKTGTQQLYPARFENLKKTVKQLERVRSKIGGKKRRA